MKVSYFADAYVDRLMLAIVDAALAGKAIYYTVIPDDPSIFRTNRSQHRLHIEDQGVICKWMGDTNVSESVVRTITVEEAQKLLDGERCPK